MNNNYWVDIVNKLIERKLTIATMESCTGGGIANEITNISGASAVIKESYVTYCNEAKIKQGVAAEVIDKYSVYSMETAKSMSKKISDFANSNYGVGITGKINRSDKNNMYGSDNLVYVCIYDRDNDKYYNMSIDTIDASRRDNKEMIIRNIVKLLLTII